MAGSAKALGKGSAAPGSVAEGLIRLYSMRFCPFAQRTRLFLEAKGIKHETININLKNKPDWFFEKNPFGLVPVLETSKKQMIYESPITCEYLDEVYPGKKLIPADPYEKARQKMLLEHFSKLQPYFYKIPMARKNGEDTSVLEGEFREKLGKLNTTLANQKSQFFGGDSVSMIDYMMWPFFERLEVNSLNHCLEHTPHLTQWISTMLEDPAVKKTITDIETYKGFYNLYLQGSMEAYDYGL
ncbi:glutathione S-transferase omega-1 [Latimeria chalumnae]|uniref:glutathione S-transferase omega-1 n=1 Tax=Latimeria chalumnae TaxID=7897 RepID=UPI0006D940D8|nr:PREDICTED: glutathione S-transferase omega-1 [Latimeria chalumnae]|eukprot:XP_014343794.1 PREDICTED: glutathione S-transferase omega-1 [Latimeria chalumnae]